VPAAAGAASTISAHAPAVAAYGVRLAEAAAKVSDTISLGVRDGISQARIQLSPGSLGTIQIHLQRTAEGVVARVVTEHPEAAQTLADNSDDLRRSLQQNGTNLLRLDIHSSDQRRSSAQQSETGAGSAGSSAGDGDETGGDDLTVGAATDVAGAGLTSATLVNVLA
jgi:flagellar hook-length control protein FliK